MRRLLGFRLMKIVLVLLLLAGCKPVQPTSPDRPGSPAAPIDAVDTAPSPIFRGEPVAFTEPEVLHSNGEFVVERQRWRFEGREGVAWRVRVPLDGELAVHPSDDVVDFSSLLPEQPGPWAAINGGFYEPVPDDPDRTGRPMGLVVANGVEHSKLTRRGGSGVLYVDAEGAHVVHRKGFQKKPQHALQSIDRLADHAVSVVKRREMPGALRSAVAVGEQHLWLIATAADKDISEREHGAKLSRSDEGLPLWAFADFVLASTDTVEALNLDGGISTQLAVRDGDYRLRIRGVRGTINAVVMRPPSR